MQAKEQGRSITAQLFPPKAASFTPFKITSSHRGLPSTGRCRAADNGNGNSTNGNSKTGNGGGPTGGEDAGASKPLSSIDSPIVPEPCIVSLNSMSEDLTWIASGHGTIEGSSCDWNVRRVQPQMAFATPKKAEVQLRNEVRHIPRQKITSEIMCRLLELSRFTLCRKTAATVEMDCEKWRTIISFRDQCQKM